MLTRDMEIDGYEFKVTTLGSKEATSLWFRAAGNLGAALASSFSSANDDRDAGSAMMGAIAQAVIMMPSADFDYILGSLAKQTFVKVPNSQAHLPLSTMIPTPADPFAGRMDLLVKYLMFALEVNFGSFLDKRYEPLTSFMTRLMNKDQ